MPVLRADLLDVAGERGLEAEVVERRRAQRPRQRQAAPASPGWPVPWSRPARDRASGGAFSRAASRRSSTPVSDWLTSSWRSRATRARSSSCACSAALAVRRRSASRRSSIRRNASSRRSTSSVPEPRSARPPSSTRIASGRRAPSRRPARSRGSNRRWSMNRLTRTVSATAKREHEAHRGFVFELGAGVGRQARRDHRHRDQQQVRDQDLVSRVLRRIGGSANYRHRTGGWLSPAPRGPPVRGSTRRRRAAIIRA